MKHKHADLIHAWADGQQIQWKNNDGEWEDWVNTFLSPPWTPVMQYRIKPEEKNPVVRWLWAYAKDGSFSNQFRSDEEAKKYFVDRVIKLEWSRQEFPE